MSLFHRTIAATILTACLSTSGFAGGASAVHVYDVESLYSAVNDPGNAGVTIVLDAGYYTLTTIDPHGVTRPNGGLLQLQPGMSLSGASGHPDSVVIDGSGPQFAAQTAIPATIRIGRSHETIEWLTVISAASSAAGIATDLIGDATASLRIAHVISKGSIRGIDVRNPGPGGAGRKLIIDLDDNELTANVASLGLGIRFANVTANGATIVASLHGNRSHGNLRGCLVANLASSGASISIDSHDDRFDDNSVGCVVYGGITQAATTVANDNSVTFSFHAGSVAGNAGLLQPDNQMGGFVVVGGRGQVANSTSRNSVQLSFWGTKIEVNQGADISAWGALTDASAPAGTNNVVSIDLNGASKKAVADAVPSAPTEIAGTNRVTISK